MLSKVVIIISESLWRSADNQCRVGELMQSLSGVTGGALNDYTSGLSEISQQLPAHFRTRLPELRAVRGWTIRSLWDMREQAAAQGLSDKVLIALEVPAPVDVPLDNE